MPFNPPPLTKLSNLLHLDHISSSNAQNILRATSQRGFHIEAQLSQSHPYKKLDRFTFPSILKNCAAQFDLNHGKKIHATILEMGLQSDTYIASSLIKMYVRCGSLTDAAKVFVQIPERDATVWNTMVSGYFHHGRRHDGLFLFCEMQLAGIRPDGPSLTILLGACSNYSDLEHGEQIHAYLLRNVLESDPFLGPALIDMYAKCGRVMEAYRVFDGAVDKNVFVWNTMIGGFCQNGLWEKSLELFVLMKNEGCKLESATFSSVLTACSLGEEVGFGEGVHCCLIKTGFEFDPYVCTSLLAMYAKCGLIDEASRVFQLVPSKRIELWNSMISVYIRNACAYEALDVYNQMRSSHAGSDCITISNVLSACSMTGSFDFGRRVHGELIKRPELYNVVVQSSLMTMYLKCGSIDDASSLFSSIKLRDIVVWGSMIAGFCQNKKFEEALGLFDQLEEEGLKPDSAVIASVISACAGLERLELGCQIHGYAIKVGTSSDVFVGSALIDMYAKCGLPESCGIVFSSMPYKNLVVWNSMVCSYSRNGLLDRAIGVFAQISQHGLVPDYISITSVLAAVSSLASLMKGKAIHGYQVRNKIVSDMQVENALLDMYMKCGCLRYAQCIFERMRLRNVIAWNTMIAGYGSHGHCLKALGLFEEMQRLKVAPDDITFLSLISSCSHSGLVEEGLALFHSMSRDYGIVPTMEHYANIVDLLGRAGRLNEAYGFIQSMPIKADESVWLCLLSSCRAHRHVSLGELAADHLLKLKMEVSGSCIQLINLYGEVGLSDKAANIRVLMKREGLKKNPGCSWIEVRNKVEVFYSGDSSSPLTTGIHDTLKNLGRTIREEDEFS